MGQASCRFTWLSQASHIHADFVRAVRLLHSYAFALHYNQILSPGCFHQQFLPPLMARELHPFIQLPVYTYFCIAD